MKSTGIVKHIDSLGRFKLPRELLNFYDIKPRTKLQIKLKGKKIILEREKSNCIFCFCSKNIHEFKNKKICENCIKKIKTMI